MNSPDSASAAAGDHRDALPADLDADAAAFAGAYEFPDNSRRRIPGIIYLTIAAVCLVVWLLADDRPVVNDGWAWAALVLGAVGVFSITSGWRMRVDEKQALVAAHQAAGFPVGHASAQQVWHGVRSRPTWRVLAYSADEPPTQRALVLVDAVDGHVIEHLVQPLDAAAADSAPGE
ncbi:MAG TPA: hypothetical protein VNQ73_05965 [Ilumatobacter sp.]|nr:hypothetical protein [Ilumatobacter sp.]